MELYLLNLDRSTDRLDYFSKTNKHLTKFIRFSAVDGKSLDKDMLVRDGLITRDLTYTMGAIGCALSHRKLWIQSASENKSMTICEDDAIFSYFFEKKRRELLNSIDEDWDIIIWGYNFRAYIWAELIPGNYLLEIRLDQHRLVKDIENFQSADSPTMLMRLTHAFQTLCYSISPAGARKLLDKCFPLRKQLISFKDYGIVIENEGIDCIMNAIYPEINSYICFAPLATSAEIMKSTIR